MNKLVYLWSKDNEITNVKIARNNKNIVVIYDETETKKNDKGELINCTYTNTIKISPKGELLSGGKEK